MLRRVLGDYKEENKNLHSSRDEANRRCERLTESNRTLILQLEENRAAVANFEV
jgi:hypothetical protein